MASGKQLKANELVLLVAGLLKFDVDLMARVGNLPVRNLKSWLAGKKDNLRVQSIVHLFSLLGLTVSSSGIRLDEKRVHFWNVSERLFTSKRATYAPLGALSKLMAGCAITEVKSPQTGFVGGRKRRHFLVSGEGVRVVICVNKGLFGKPMINPEVIKGACWRDDSEKHVITASNSLWSHVLDQDLTTHEFDRMFNETRETVTWFDVSLMAREVGATPADVSQWLVDKYGGSQMPANDAEEDTGLDIDGGSGRIFLLAGRRAA